MLNRDIVNIKFFAANQVKQKIKRTFEYIEIHLIIICK